MDWDALQKKFDKKNVLQPIRNYPGQLRAAVETGKKFFPTETRAIEKIVFCGMGASGMAGLVVKEVLSSEIKVPIEVVEDYSLPAYADEKTLVVAISFSGNTEETIACFEEAKRRGSFAAAVASGGMLAETAEAKIIVPTLSQPRLGTISMAVALIFVLEKLGLVESMEKELLDCAGFLEKESGEIGKEAKKIALKLKGKFPIIEAPAEFGVLSYRLRVELNENPKILALSNCLPEMNHNEINSEILPKNSCFLFFRDNEESEKMKRRFEFTKKNFKKYPQIEIRLNGKNKIEKIFYGIFISALVSYYLALLNKTDPEKIPVIQNLKKALV
ncbi:MAG: bifunctional phosphoglucose/phosphomannose isomerase [Candidatus ainarchaeum sp.]|nr:bifunctional phosphoglucose/phosphomannose isomerase [Candidatus ainarchaeum sp.]